MELFRIYTQDGEKYRANVEDLVASEFTSFTILTGKGHWCGAVENSLIVEIISAAPDAYQRVQSIARKVRDYNKQDAVLVTRTPITSELI